MPSAVLSPAIDRYVGEFITRWRRVRIVRAAGLTVLLLTLWMLLSCGLDRLLKFSIPIRIGMLGIGVLVSLIPLMRIVFRARRATDWVESAEQIERQNPRFR